MKSKASFFNFGIYKTYIKRLWLLWVIPALFAIIFPMSFYTNIVDYSDTRVISKAEVEYYLYDGISVALPIAVMGFALTVALFVWNYLYSSRSICMMHSIPVSKGAMYFSTVLAGLTIIIIPFIFVGISVVAVCLLLGVVAVKAWLTAAFVALCEIVLFFGFASLVAQISGSGSSLASLYVFFNFLSYILERLCKKFCFGFLYGVMDYSEAKLIAFSPVLNLWDKVNAVNEYSERGVISSSSLSGLNWALNYAFVGVVLFVLGFIIYKNNKSENAADFIASKPLSAPIRYVTTIVGSLLLTTFVYDTFTNYSGVKFELGPVICIIILASTVAYFLTLMLFKKDYRVFNKKSFVGLSIILILFVGTSILFGFDCFDIEKRVPQMSEIESVKVGIGQNVSYPIEFTDNVEAIDCVRQLHESILKNKEYYQEYEEHYSKLYVEPVYLHSSTYVSFVYKLKNGKTVTREYLTDLCYDEIDKDNTPENYLYKLLNTDEAVSACLKGSLDRIVYYAVLTDSDHDYVEFGASGSYDDAQEVFNENYKDISKLYEALHADYKENACYYKTWFEGFKRKKVYYNEYSLAILIRFTNNETERKDLWNFEGVYENKLMIYPDMKHTLDFIADVSEQNGKKHLFDLQSYGIY